MSNTEELIDHVRSCVECHETGQLSAEDCMIEIGEMLATYDSMED